MIVKHCSQYCYIVVFVAFPNPAFGLLIVSACQQSSTLLGRPASLRILNGAGGGEALQQQQQLQQLQQQQQQQQQPTSMVGVKVSQLAHLFQNRSREDAPSPLAATVAVPVAATRKTTTTTTSTAATAAAAAAPTTTTATTTTTSRDVTCGDKEAPTPEVTVY